MQDSRLHLRPVHRAPRIEVPMENVGTGLHQFAFACCELAEESRPVRRANVLSDPRYARGAQHRIPKETEYVEHRGLQARVSG